MWTESLIATTMWGVSPIFEKQFAQHVSIETIGVMFILFILMTGPFLLYATRRTWVPEISVLFSAKRAVLFHALATCIVSIIAWTSYILAMQRSDNQTYLVVMLTCTYPLITALLLMIFFHERIGKREWLAIVLIIFGLALLSYPRIAVAKK